MHLSHVKLVLAAVSLAVVAVGCQDDGQHKYGMKPMSDAAVDSSPSAAVTNSSPDGSTTLPPPPTVVPAGSQRLSQGTYNQIQFTVPSTSGAIYVYDMDTQKVVGMTNAVAGDANRPMTMADLKNTSQGLNMADHYQIYFAPTHTIAQPIGGGSGM